MFVWKKKWRWITLWIKLRISNKSQNQGIKNIDFDEVLASVVLDDNSEDSNKLSAQTRGMYFLVLCYYTLIA